jgi:peptidoglycan/LPS O-acetylase OafA/YrhL
MAAGERVKKSVERLSHLDGLRGIAAATVLLCHAVGVFDFGMITGDPKYSHLWIDQFVPRLPFMFHIMADLPVCIFFVLSGYVLCHAFRGGQNTLIGAIAKRYARLTPVILVSSIFAFGLYSAFGEIHRDAIQVTKSYGAGLNLPNGIPPLSVVLSEGIYKALLGGFSYETTINSVLWTMRPEFQGSILVITIAWIGSIWGAGSPAQRATVVTLHSLVAILWSGTYISLFSAGALLAVLPTVPAVRSSLLIIFGLTIGTLPNALITNWPIPPMPSLPFSTIPHSGTSFYHGVGALLLVVGVTKNVKAQSYLSTNLAKFLGDISFALYLVHFPILLTVGSWIVLLATSNGAQYGFAVLLAFTASVSLSVAVAYLLSKSVDQAAIAASRSICRSIDTMFFGLRDIAMDRITTIRRHRT